MIIVDVYTLSLACMILFYALILILFYEILSHVKRPKSELTPKEAKQYIREINRAFHFKANRE